MNRGFPPRFRIPFIALGMLSLIAGVLAGLIRLGWNLPVPWSTLPVAHGPLMVSGFLGTVIGVERAVALDRRWAYNAPLLTGLGGLALMAGLPGQLLMTLGSLVLVVVFVVIVRRQPTLFTATMGLGALVWLMGNILYLSGRPLYTIVPWWIGFLALTIGGERLELARLVQLSPTSHTAFLVIIGLFSAGLVLTAITFETGMRLVSVGLLLLSLWLLHHDIARRTVRQTGLVRFSAVCLLSGYVWLGLSGLMGLLSAELLGGLRYDAILHAFFLGFVFAMIFGHAPIIFPAVLNRPISFQTAFYAHLALLHLSLLLRIAGDLLAWLPGRRWGGLLNAVALLLFLINTERSMGKSPTKPAVAEGKSSA